MYAICGLSCLTIAEAAPLWGIIIWERYIWGGLMWEGDHRRRRIKIKRNWSSEESRAGGSHSPRVGNFLFLSCAIDRLSDKIGTPRNWVPSQTLLPVKGTSLSETSKRSTRVWRTRSSRWISNYQRKIINILFKRYLGHTHHLIAYKFLSNYNH